MKSIEKAKLLDFILNEMVIDQEKTKSNIYNYDFIETLFYRLKKDNNPIFSEISMDSEMAEDLFKLIYNQDFEGNPILKQIDHGNSYKNAGNPYYNTHDFIASGGFNSLYEIENKNYIKTEEKKNYDFKISKNQATLTTGQKITFWITFAAALIALGLSIFNTFFKTN